MRVLVLGGTRFVGRYIVEALLDAGHDVTLFNRGTHSDVFPGVQLIRGDRASERDAAALASVDAETVIDVSAYRPAQVQPAIRHAGDARQYVYISTVSVYADPVAEGADESAPLLELNGVQDSDPRSYGANKAECERQLADAFGERLTIVRPTVVIGPHDYTDRFTWWVRRAVMPRPIPVPARMTQPVQLIDARDLGAFVERLVSQRTRGTFNAVGPAEPLTLDGMLAAIAEGTGASPGVRSLPEGAPDRIPLALPADGSDDGAFTVSNAAARAAGLQLRPPSESAADVRRWDADRGEPPLLAGPAPDEDERLLSASAQS